MDDRLVKGLEALGLNNKERKVYSTLLSLGRATAYSIAKHSGLKRPTVYVLLENLEHAGIVRKLPTHRAQVYAPKAPKDLFDEAEKRLANAKTSIEKLQGLWEKTSEEIQVFSYEGLQGVFEAMRYGLSSMSNKELKVVWADVSKETDARFNHFNEPLKRYRDNNIRLRGIIPDGAIHDSYRAQDKEYGRNIRPLPKDMFCPYTFFDIGDTFVRFFDPVHMQAIVIDNPGIRDTMSQIFELVWEAVEDQYIDWSPEWACKRGHK